MAPRRVIIKINGIANYEVLGSTIPEKVHSTLKSAITAVTGAGHSFTLFFAEPN